MWNRLSNVFNRLTLCVFLRYLFFKCQFGLICLFQTVPFGNFCNERVVATYMVEASKNYVIWLEGSMKFVFHQFLWGEADKIGGASFMLSFKACPDTAWTWWDLFDTACRAYFIKISI